MRARREDIPLLVEHILGEANARCGLVVEGVTREALSVVESLPWHGNVRELEAVIRRSMIFRGDGWVRPEDLELGPARSARTGTTGRSVHVIEPRSTRQLTLVEREALRLAGERHEISRSDLMACCGISRELARRQLGGLVSAGLLRRVGRGRGVRYAPVALAPIFEGDAAPEVDPS